MIKFSPLLMLFLQLASIAASAQNNPNATPAPAADVICHKVRVGDPVLARQIAAQGGRLIADYGNNQLYEVATVDPDP
jgi:hypothetical protein